MSKASEIMAVRLQDKTIRFFHRKRALWFFEADLTTFLADDRNRTIGPPEIELVFQSVQDMQAIRGGPLENFIVVQGFLDVIASVSTPDVSDRMMKVIRAGAAVWSLPSALMATARMPVRGETGQLRKLLASSDMFEGLIASVPYNERLISSLTVAQLRLVESLVLSVRDRRLVERVIAGLDGEFAYTEDMLLTMNWPKLKNYPMGELPNANR
ncbi:hypothetical protein IB276_05545 [Ensifer sp. ENS04]|uniref:hypothetical protein n=1 Tax=Ensifer sp. ENS04 TaxID=2769281 RepID=UPI0017850CC0|nr:hypothetical protein [Ensifer sp. ENS04]MBD9538903.1 hypothetical protein [Ensifer sp. ENS04]